MNKEQLIKMDPYMLLSIINMKLRNEFNNLEDFCYDINIENEFIIEKLEEIGYKYDKELNQFVSRDYAEK